MGLRRWVEVYGLRLRMKAPGFRLAVRSRDLERRKAGSGRPVGPTGRY